MKPHYILVTQSSHLKTIWRPAWFPWKGQFGGWGGATAEGWRPLRSHAGSVPVCFPLYAQDTSRNLHVKHACIEAQKENIDKGCVPVYELSSCLHRGKHFLHTLQLTNNKKTSNRVHKIFRHLFTSKRRLKFKCWTCMLSRSGPIIKWYMRTKWEPPQKPCDWNC